MQQNQRLHKQTLCLINNRCSCNTRNEEGEIVQQDVGWLPKQSELNPMVDMGEQVEARGRGTGVLFPSSLITDSVTQQGKFAYNHVDVKYTRMLKCGQTAGIKLNKVSLSKDKQWGLLSLHSKQQMLKCDCIENLVQDIQHLVYECVARGHLIWWMKYF